MPTLRLAHLGVDECGSLSDATEWFVVAGVLTYQPEAVRSLIRRTASRSAQRLGRPRRAISEFKWSNASQRFRSEVLQRLAQAEVEVFALAIHKEKRRVEDTPEHYSILVCELLRSCWSRHPNVALSLDRRFTSASQVAVVNTFVYRHWPPPGVLTISHVDSQRNPLVQLADFVAGSIYARHKSGDTTCEFLGDRLRAETVADWPGVKRQWASGW
jgi:Protein of unknown function (DUF3800)